MIGNPHLRKEFEERDKRIEVLEKRLAKLEKAKSKETAKVEEGK